MKNGKKHSDHPATQDRPEPSRDSDLPRKKGAQPGNNNAFKHGFYSTIFKEEERRILSEVPLTDLTAEIELIRVTIKRFLEALAASRAELDFETQLTALRAVNLSAQSIATLLRAQAVGTVEDRDFALLTGSLNPPPPKP